MDTRFKPYHLKVVTGKKVFNKKKLLFFSLIVAFCMITPFSNWFIFVAKRFIKLSEVIF